MNLKTGLYFLLFAWMGSPAVAQIHKVIRKDTASLEVRKKQVDRNQLVLTPSDTKTELTGQLQQILKRYRHRPNEESTWKAIRDEASNLLHTYYRNGRLAGNHPNAAYYVKMGPDTMTAADLANNRMILVAGIALTKPYEFEILRIVN